MRRILRTSFWLALALCALVLPARAGYRVQNGKIYDDANQVVQLRGVNWFGFETQNYVVHGLWTRNWQSMITQMKANNFNAVRLPFCPTTIRGGYPNSIDYSRNADLQNLSSLQILDLIVNRFNRHLS